MNHKNKKPRGGVLWGIFAYRLRMRIFELLRLLSAAVVYDLSQYGGYGVINGRGAFQG